MSNVLFSIVIPAYNRAHTLERAVTSVLRQNINDLEIIIVDDASTDGTRDFVLSLSKNYPIRLISHQINRGIGPTRNTGIRVARGDWILPLDSDDEFAPGILSDLKSLLPSLPDDIQRIRGMVKCDDGSLSPVPNLQFEEWDYERYVRSLNVKPGTLVESASAYKRSSLLKIPYQQGRTSESLFHLDYFYHYRVQSTNLVFRLYHDGAGNTTRDPKPICNVLRDELDWAIMTDQLLARHGQALKQWAPIAYYGFIHRGVKHHLICSNKKRAIELACIGARRPTPRFFSYLLFGLLHPTVLAKVSRIPSFVRKAL